MYKIVITSTIVSVIVSFSMMKLQMKMLYKWMDEFFEKEEDTMVSFYNKESRYEK